MPQQYRLILKNIDAPGYTNDLDCYVRHGGYEALKKAFEMGPRVSPDGGTVSGPEKIRKTFWNPVCAVAAARFFVRIEMVVSWIAKAANRFISSATPMNPSPAPSKIARSFTKIRIS